jgi:hypothetical protein
MTIRGVPGSETSTQTAVSWNIWCVAGVAIIGITAV